MSKHIARIIVTVIILSVLGVGTWILFFKPGPNEMVYLELLGVMNSKSDKEQAINDLEGTNYVVMELERFMWPTKKLSNGQWVDFAEGELDQLYPAAIRSAKTNQSLKTGETFLSDDFLGKNGTNYPAPTFNGAENERGEISKWNFTFKVKVPLERLFMGSPFTGSPSDENFYRTENGLFDASTFAQAVVSAAPHTYYPNWAVTPGAGSEDAVKANQKYQLQNAVLTLWDIYNEKGLNYNRFFNYKYIYEENIETSNLTGVKNTTSVNLVKINDQLIKALEYYFKYSQAAEGVNKSAQDKTVKAIQNYRDSLIKVSNYAEEVKNFQENNLIFDNFFEDDRDGRGIAYSGLASYQQLRSMYQEYRNKYIAMLEQLYLLVGSMRDYNIKYVFEDKFVYETEAALYDALYYAMRNLFNNEKTEVKVYDITASGTGGSLTAAIEIKNLVVTPWLEALYDASIIAETIASFNQSNTLRNGVNANEFITSFRKVLKNQNNLIVTNNDTNIFNRSNYRKLLYTLSNATGKLQEKHENEISTVATLYQNDVNVVYKALGFGAESYSADTMKTDSRLEEFSTIVMAKLTAGQIKELRDNSKTIGDETQTQKDIVALRTMLFGSKGLSEKVNSLQQNIESKKTNLTGSYSYGNVYYLKELIGLLENKINALEALSNEILEELETLNTETYSTVKSLYTECVKEYTEVLIQLTNIEAYMFKILGWDKNTRADYVYSTMVNTFINKFNNEKSNPLSDAGKNAFANVNNVEFILSSANEEGFLTTYNDLSGVVNSLYTMSNKHLKLLAKPAPAPEHADEEEYNAAVELIGAENVEKVLTLLSILGFAV